jgi:activator of 2-hydroxyglutaryl-CoA dehydratase
MVGETIAMVSTLASRQYKDSNPELPIVITGGGTLNSALINNLEFTYKYLNNQKYVIPENAVFATLHGVFLAKDMYSN